MDHMRLRFLVLLCLIFNLAVSTAAKAAEAIHWYDWGAEAFNAAARQNKLILVNVGMERSARIGRKDCAQGDTGRRAQIRLQ